jgi:hypothetical protein
VLLVIGNDGKDTMANYRVQQQTYISMAFRSYPPSLETRLVLNTGKKAQKVDFSRENKG